ncbi:MAG TPA: class I SAM-dependent methyltransferase [Anaerolineae bacterium]
MLQGIFFDRVHQAVLTQVAHRLAPNSLLDVGCGTGRLLRSARIRWPHALLFGVDPAEGMLEVARHLTHGVTFKQGFAEALPFPDASVDVVLSTVSFHHWQDHAAGVREVARVLRPGGYFFLTDVHYPAWLARLIRHPSAPSAARVCTLFSEAGMRVIMQRPAALRFALSTVGERPQAG